MSEDQEDLDLGDLLPDEVFNHPDCFDSSRYWKWEDEIATPALREKGFEVGSWFSVEEDSFGPLIRAVRLKAESTWQTYYYG